MFKSIYRIPQKLIDILNINKFKVFSPENLKSLYQSLNYLKKKESKFAQISNMMNRAGDLLKTAISTPGSNPQAPVISKTFAGLSSTYIHRHKHHALCLQLDNPLFWSDSFKAAANGLNESVSIVYQNWRTHGKYANYSSPDLIFIYQNIFTKLSIWLSKAKKELAKKGHKLPTRDFNDYKKLLNQLEAELNYEKQIARTSLIARLEVGIKVSDLSFDDIAQATVKELEALKVLPDTVTIKTKGIHRHLTPAGLKKIRYIIHCEGKEEEKTRLTSLLHASNNAVNLTARVNQKGYVFSIPTMVSKLVADKPPFYTRLPRPLHRFFSDSKMSYEFFQNDICQYLLVSHESLMRLPVTETFTFATLTNSKVWIKIQNHLNLLEIEETRIKKVAGNLLRFLHPNTKQVIADYANNLQVIGQTIVKKQTALLVNLVAALEAKSDSLNTIEIQQLKYLHDKCAKDITMHTYNPCEVASLLMRITLLTTPNNKVSSVNTTYEEATQVTAKLAQGVPVTDKDLTVVESAIGALPASPKFFNAAQVSFVLNKRLAEQNMPFLLQEELKKSPFAMTSQQVVEHTQKVTRLIQTIESQQETLIPSAKLQQALYQYVFRLLTEISEMTKPAIFNKQTGVIAFVINNLRKLSKSDAVFHKLLDQIIKFENQFKLFDWDDFLSIYVKPLVKNLKNTTENLNTEFEGGDYSSAAESTDSESESMNVEVTPNINMKQLFL